AGGTHVGCKKRQLPSSHPRKSDAPRHAIGDQPPGPDELGQGPAPDAEQELQLEGTVLRLAESEPKPGVFGVAGVDMRDPPAVTADAQRPVQPLDLEVSGSPWQPSAHQAQQQLGPVGAWHGPHYTRPNEPHHRAPPGPDAAG